MNSSDKNDDAGNETTHERWICPNCDTEVWLPIGKMKSQSEHSERIFCGCSDQGRRMSWVAGQERDMSL